MALTREHWRQEWRLWAPALAFFLLNLAAVLGYRIAGVGDQANLEQQRLDAAKQQEASLAEQHAKLRLQVEQTVENQERVRSLYQDRLSTQSERLTQIIAELRQLARQSGMVPARVNYPQQDIEDFGLVEKAFVFAVTGSYADLRKFITALELTDSFLTLQSIRLNSAEGGKLSIGLRLSTLFADAETAALLAEESQEL